MSFDFNDNGELIGTIQDWASHPELLADDTSIHETVGTPEPRPTSLGSTLGAAMVEILGQDKPKAEPANHVAVPGGVFDRARQRFPASEKDKATGARLGKVMQRGSGK